MAKRLDEELANAVRAAEAAPPPDADAVRPSSGQAPAGKKKTSLGFLVALLAVAGAIVALFLVGVDEAAVYAVPVDRVLGDETLKGRVLRVEGDLVQGTLAKRDEPCEYRFTMKGQTTELPVRYTKCVIPDTFRDQPGVQVTVEGKWAGDHFDASLVMAKCTSKYDPKTHEIKGGPAAPGPLSAN